MELQPEGGGSGDEAQPAGEEDAGPPAFIQHKVGVEWARACRARAWAACRPARACLHRPAPWEGAGPRRARKALTPAVLPPASCRSPAGTRWRASPSSTTSRWVWCGGCSAHPAGQAEAARLHSASVRAPALSPTHTPTQQPTQVADLKRFNGLLSDSAMYARGTILVPTKLFPVGWVGWGCLPALPECQGHTDPQTRATLRTTPTQGGPAAHLCAGGVRLWPRPHPERRRTAAPCLLCRGACGPQPERRQPRPREPGLPGGRR